jgi:eukaryotic translation initiation factor 2-alpha kinase 4
MLKLADNKVLKLKLKLNNKDLLIVSLLEYICNMCNKSDDMFWTICDYLYQNGIITDPKVFEIEQSDIRHMCQKLIHTLLNQNALENYAIEPYIEKSRYKTDFIEMKKLGKGGYGTVYMVYNKLDECIYAIKKINIKKLSDESHYLEEVKFLSKLSHPHIVRYYATWIEFDSNQKYVTPMLYIQMEYCKTTLERYIMDHNFNEQDQQQKHICKQLIEALAYIHRNDIIHGDLNPSNIFLTEDYHVKIGDFGLAKKCTDNTTIDTDSNGNVMYMAPEQSTSKQCCKKSDIYSLGLIFLELFIPFRTLMEKVIVIEQLKKGNYTALNNLEHTHQELLKGMLDLDHQTRWDFDKIKI